MSRAVGGVPSIAFLWAVSAEEGALIQPAAFRRFTCLLFVLAVSAQLISCAGGGRGMRPVAEAWFNADVLAGVSEDGSHVATVTVSIPYRNLVFFKTESGFQSDFEIRAIQRFGEQALKMQKFDGGAFAETYEQTHARKAVRQTFSVDLLGDRAKDGAVELEIIVSVDRTQRSARRVVRVDTSRLRQGGVSLGELALYRLRDRIEEPRYERQVMGRAEPDPAFFVRQNGATFDMATGEPWLLIRVFDLRGVAETEPFVLEVSSGPDSDEQSRWTETLELNRISHETSMLVRVPASAFAFGRNRISVALRGSETTHVLLENLGLDLSDDESWRANVNQIEVIADSDEVDAMRGASADEREAQWDAFWKKRDPDLQTTENERLHEHYRRIAYARSFLRDGFRDGALSDRGRVWVLHGRPEEIDTDAPGIDSFVMYEVWRYPSVGLAYYFRDTDGLGAYRLVWREVI